MTYKYEHDFEMYTHTALCCSVSLSVWIFFFSLPTNCLDTLESEATSVRRMEILLAWMQQKKEEEEQTNEELAFILPSSEKVKQITKNGRVHELGEHTIWKQEQEYSRGQEWLWGENPTSLHYLLMAPATDSNKRISTHTYISTNEHVPKQTLVLCCMCWAWVSECVFNNSCDPKS